MKTVKMNCASCGAPITIPDDVDTITCTACGTSLGIDRGEGYISLKILEKLADTLKENALVTQLELKRMQLSQMINLEEMKISGLQSELRAAKRLYQADPQNYSDLTDLLLTESDCLLRIRDLNQQIARLEPNWHETLTSIDEDIRCLERALKPLSSYAALAVIGQRIFKINAMLSERRREYSRLETEQLSKEIASMGYPPYYQLTLDQKEELLTLIPQDLSRLQAKKQTEVVKAKQKELSELFQKIKKFYPREKVESQTGKLKTLTLSPPYPEEPFALKPMVELAQVELAKVQSIPMCIGKMEIAAEIQKILSALTWRMKEDIPAQRATAKKRKRTGWLVSLGVVFGVCLIIILAISAAQNKRRSPYINTVPTQQVAAKVQQEEEMLIITNTPKPNQAHSIGETGGFEKEFLEITSWRTYLRDEPSTDATEILLVSQHDLLEKVDEKGLSPLWYKVVTLDGETTGYLYQDWAKPVTIKLLAGKALPKTGNTLYQMTFSTPDDEWQAETYNGTFFNAASTFTQGAYQMNITFKQDDSYSYVQHAESYLPAQWLYSVDTNWVSGSDGLLYGIQFNYLDEQNFDVALIDPEGNLVVAALKNNTWVNYFNSSRNAAAAAVNTKGSNILAVQCMADAETQSTHYILYINGESFLEVTYDFVQTYDPLVGVLVYGMKNGDKITLQIDNLKISQVKE